MVSVPPWWEPVRDALGELSLLLALQAVAARATTARPATSADARGRCFTAFLSEGRSSVAGDPGVESGVGEVDEHVGEHDQEGGEARHAEDDGQVELADRVDQQGAEPLHAEDL